MHWVPILLTLLRGKHYKFGVITGGVGTQALGCSLAFCFNIVHSIRSLLKPLMLKVGVLKIDLSCGLAVSSYVVITEPNASAFWMVATVF